MTNPIIGLTIIATPYSAPTQALKARNIAYARFCLMHSIDKGEIPFASHLLYTQVLNDDQPSERALGVKLSKAFFYNAKRLAVYEDLGRSPGMTEEIVLAKSLDLPIVYRRLSGAKGFPLSPPADDRFPFPTDPHKPY